jgi:excisionase family DNA binding protein
MPRKKRGSDARPPDVGSPLLYTYEEAWTKLGVTESQFYTLKQNGEIRVLELGPQVRRVPLSELESYVARKIAEQWGTGRGSAA